MKIAGTKREKFLQFLMEQYFLEPQFTDMYNMRYTSLDQMCWI